MYKIKKEEQKCIISEELPATIFRRRKNEETENKLQNKNEKE